MATPWQVYGNDTVACRLSRADLPGFFRKRIVVGPHEAAIVIHNGKAQEALTEKRAKVAGALDKFARLLGGGADIEVLFVTLAPVQFSVYLGETLKGEVSATQSSASGRARTGERGAIDLVAASERAGWIEGTTARSTASATEAARLDISRLCLQAVSLDQEVIPAECLFRVSVDIEEAEQVTGLMRGKVALASWDLAALIRDELIARVLIPEIATHRADELRGNRQLLDKMHQEVQTQLRDTLGACGLSLESFTISWGLTEQELADIDRRRQEREEEALTFAHGRNLAELHREMEVERTRLTNLQELKAAEAQGDEELKNLHLAGEVHRDLLVEGKRVDEAKIDAQAREIQLGIQTREAQARLQQQRDAEMLRLDVEDREWRQKQAERLAQLEAEDKEMQSMVRMQIEMAAAKHEREMAARRQEIQARHDERRTKLEEDLARMGMAERLVSKGLDTGAADASVLKTMLEQSTEQAYATTSDEKVKARAEAQAEKGKLEAYKEAEDRERQQQRAMTGLSAEMMASAKPGPGAPPGVAPAAGPCPKCGSAIQLDWKACPKCGQELGAPPLKCPNCNGDVQTGWKACPNCGAQLATRCPKCGKDVQPAWKACPSCGQALD
jgi:hypothetical protein